jgi:hypothetical protein
VAVVVVFATATTVVVDVAAIAAIAAIAVIAAIAAVAAIAAGVAAAGLVLCVFSHKSPSALLLSVLQQWWLLFLLRLWLLLG